MKLLCYVGASWGSIRVEPAGSAVGACCGVALVSGPVVFCGLSSLASRDLVVRGGVGWRCCRTGRLPPGACLSCDGIAQPYTYVHTDYSR